jgi:hypothetical protein
MRMVYYLFYVKFLLAIATSVDWLTLICFLGSVEK